MFRLAHVVLLYGVKRFIPFSSVLSVLSMKEEIFRALELRKASERE